MVLLTVQVGFSWEYCDIVSCEFVLLFLVFADGFLVHDLYDCGLSVRLELILDDFANDPFVILNLTIDKIAFFYFFVSDVLDLCVMVDDELIQRRR